MCACSAGPATRPPCHDPLDKGEHDAPADAPLPTRPCRRALSRAFPHLLTLSLSLLSLPWLSSIPAHAQTNYTGPVYSGGKATTGTSTGTHTFDYTSSGIGWGGAAATGHGYTAQCSGSITADFIWPTSSPIPAPQSAIVVENSTVTVNAFCYAYALHGDPTASCSDGMGDTGTVSTTYGTGRIPEEVKSCTLSHTRYSVQGGGSISLSCDPEATAATPNGDAKASVSYSAAVYPVTIVPGGATSDGNGGWDILVGQKCAPSLNGIPAACTVSNYHWSVTGTTMQSWTVSADQSYTTEVDGPGPLNIPVPLWYWNDQNQTTETITCTATVTPPAGQGSAFSVTASQKVGVYLPSWTASGYGGEMLVDTKEPNENGTDYWLHAGPTPASGQPGGMSWRAYVSPTTSAPVTFGQGFLEIMQLVTPGMRYINGPGEQFQLADEGQIGLDTSFPYGWVMLEDPNYPVQPDYYLTNDNPGFDLTSTQAVYGVVAESFQDYLMYEPPGSAVYVPLGTFTWNTNGSAIIPSSYNWGNYANPAGPVSPSGGWVKFNPQNTYPSWTRNSGDGIGFVQLP